MQQSKDSWNYYPGYIKDDCWEEMYTEIGPLCLEHTVEMYGKQIVVKRRSTVFSDYEGDGNRAESRGFSYGGLTTHSWSESELMKKLKKQVEEKVGVEFDYCLVHLYPDGEAPIAWHRDRECLNTRIASLSFGATRKFRMRPINHIKGWTHEFKLNSGDLFMMEAGCQRRYMHCVPIEKRVKEPRISLTFRCFESE